VCDGGSYIWRRNGAVQVNCAGLPRVEETQLSRRVGQPGCFVFCGWRGFGKCRLEMKPCVDGVPKEDTVWVLGLLTHGHDNVESAIPIFWIGCKRPGNHDCSGMQRLFSGGGGDGRVERE